MRKKIITLYEQPQLTEPSLVAGFTGLPDAEMSSTGPLLYLLSRLQPEKLGGINPTNFYVFSSTRPQGTIENGRVKGVTYPQTDILLWKNYAGRQDLLFLLGSEPDLRWEEYTNAVVRLGKEFDVKRLYTLGGVYSRVPHTREPQIFAVINNKRLIPLLEHHKIDLAPDYKGPISFNTALLHAAAKERLDGIGLWVHVPFYLRSSPFQQRYHHALLKKLTGLLDLELDLDDIEETDKGVEEQFREFVEQNPDLSELVRQLEREHDTIQLLKGVKINPNPRSN